MGIHGRLNWYIELFSGNFNLLLYYWWVFEIINDAAMIPVCVCLSAHTHFWWTCTSEWKDWVWGLIAVMGTPGHLTKWLLQFALHLHPVLTVEPFRIGFNNQIGTLTNNCRSFFFFYNCSFLKGINPTLSSTYLIKQLYCSHVNLTKHLNPSTLKSKSV